MAGILDIVTKRFQQFLISMSLQCLPLSLGLIRLMVWEMSFEEWRPSWISGRNDFSNSESLCRSDASHVASAQSNMVWEEMAFEEFQCGGHLRYWNEMFLANLIFYVTVMPPIKFRLNPTYGLGGDIVRRISKWRPSWISERNDFSNSESPCCRIASH